MRMSTRFRCSLLLMVALGSWGACGGGVPIRATVPTHDGVVDLEHPWGWLESRWAQTNVPLRIEGPVSVLFVPWRGERALIHGRTGRRIHLGGRTIGVDWTGLSGAAVAFRLKRGRPPGWLVVDARALTPGVVSTLRRGGPLRLAVACPLKRPCELGFLARLCGRLVGLSLKDARLPAGFERILRRLRYLEVLSLRGVRAPRAVYASLRWLWRLRALDLAGTSVNDGDLAAVAALARLTWLDLMATRIAGWGLSYLAGLRDVRHLGLAATPVTNDALRHLAPLRGLRSLDLALTRIGDRGLAGLGALRELRALDLADVRITDLGLPRLSGLTALRILRLSHHVSDAGLPALAGLRRLEVLHLRGAAVTDEGLSHLASLMRLRRVDLSGTEVTEGALQRMGFRVRWGADDSDRIAHRARSRAR